MTQTSQMPKSFPIVWALHTVGQSFGIMVAMMYMMTFWQNYMGLQVAFVTAFLTVGRSVDLVASVLAGPMVQKTNTKWGQYRPWVLGCVLFVQIGCVLMFLNTSLSLTAKGIIAAVGYMLQNIPMNFLVAANNGMMMKVVGPSMDDRMKVSVNSMRASSVGSIIINLTMWPLIEYFNKSTDSINGFLITNCLFGSVWILTTITVFIMSKPYDQQMPQMAGSGPAPSMIAIYKDILKNKEVMILFFNNFVVMLLMYGMGNMGMYYWIYSVGSMELQPLAGTISSISMLISYTFIAPIGRKLGTRKSYIIVAIAGIVAGILHGFFSHGKPWVFIGISTVSTFIMGLNGAVGMNMWLNAAEKQLYETGIDTRAATMSISSIGMKIAMVVGGVMTPFFMNLIGFEQLYSEDGTQFLGAICKYPERINKVQNWTSAGLSTITFLIFLAGYKITDEQAQFYATENQKRMMAQFAAAAAGGPGGPPPGPGGPPPAEGDE